MSIQSNTLGPGAGDGKSGPARIRAAAPFGIAAGIGLLLILPGQAKADGSYGHAEITLGFPHGQVTVGKTWDDDPQEVIVDRETRRLPDGDGDDGYVDDGDGPDHVIIEHRVHRHRHDRVTVIERYEDPADCGQEEVVRRVYVQPRERPDVIVYRRPERVVYAPSRIVYARPSHVTMAPPSGGRPGHVEERDSGPRSLFPEDQGRPMRMRGVQRQVAQVGEYSH